MERHSDHQSIPVYSIQAERSRSSTSSSGKLHFTLYIEEEGMCNALTAFACVQYCIVRQNLSNTKP